ncbi:MAG TPA: hypothetical protein VFT72_11595 [Opitutaceae bacterium]|nr:hypothetical protein [Opitutaceae bacterium]
MPNLFRLCLLVLFASRALAGVELQPDFAKALKHFRAEGAKHWGFTQSTNARKGSLIERFDPSRPDGKRWTLVQKDGHVPTEKEATEYAQKQTRRSSNDTAPDVTKQLNLSSAELVSDDAEHITYRFHLNPGDKDDTTAPFLVATFQFHKPTKTIDRIELGNTEPFSPMMVVKIQEARTTIKYTLPTAERPSLLEEITMRVRGRAMLFKSLDEDMTIAYSNYQYEGPAASALVGTTSEQPRATAPAAH